MLQDTTRPNHTKPWHADDIEKMAELLFAGRTIPEVAKVMGRTQEAVRNKAGALNFLPKRKRRNSVSKARAFSF